MVARECEGDAKVGQGIKRPCEEVAADKSLNYGSGAAYWDKRYKTDPAPFEWLRGFVEIRSLIEEAAASRSDCDVLHVGCGNSLLPEAMYDAGYKRIVNIDTSAVAIEQMEARNRGTRPEMKWLVMDAIALELPRCSYDVVLDKSVLDTFACGDSAPSVIASYLKEVSRVLRPGGSFLCVSYGAPSSRTEYLRGKALPDGLTFVREVVIPAAEKGGSTHYAYILRKA